MNCRPATRRLFGKDDDVWEEEFQTEVEELFELFAESPDNWVDARAPTTSPQQLVRMAVGIHLAAGEVLATVEWDRQNASDFNTCIQMIDLDRLSTDPMSRIDPNVRAGIRYNAKGAPLAYQIRTQHPNDIVWSIHPSRVEGGSAPQAVGSPSGHPPQGADAPAPEPRHPEMAAALKEMRMSHRSAINLQHARRAVGLSRRRSPPRCRPRPCSSSSAAARPRPSRFRAITNYAQGYLGAIANMPARRGLTWTARGSRTSIPGTKLELMSPGKDNRLRVRRSSSRCCATSPRRSAFPTSSSAATTRTRTTARRAPR
jgi:hypothetical protein